MVYGLPFQNTLIPVNFNIFCKKYTRYLLPFWNKCYNNLGRKKRLTNSKEKNASIFRNIGETLKRSSFLPQFYILFPKTEVRITIRLQFLWVPWTNPVETGIEKFFNKSNLEIKFFNL